MSRPIHFEIHADDLMRAKTFYETIFGWTITKWDGPIEYWMVMTAEKDSKEPGINGGMMKRQHPISGNDGVIAYVCTMGVENLDAMIEKTLANGGSMALPKQPIPGMGWLAYCKDTEGNVFGMMQPDENAK